MHVWNGPTWDLWIDRDKVIHVSVVKQQNFICQPSITTDGKISPKMNVKTSRLIQVSLTADPLQCGKLIDLP